jgi:hypothetical protein
VVSFKVEAEVRKERRTKAWTAPHSHLGKVSNHAMLRGNKALGLRVNVINTFEGHRLRQAEFA